ncbi:hypothetical protein PI125_g16738 [Phytophthora idaei]|nr:hypothetical protein PI125_g16738 [Phytophthora idaei]
MGTSDPALRCLNISWCTSSAATTQGGKNVRGCARFLAGRHRRHADLEAHRSSA